MTTTKYQLEIQNNEIKMLLPMKISKTEFTKQLKHLLQRVKDDDDECDKIEHRMYKHNYDTYDEETHYFTK